MSRLALLTMSNEVYVKHPEEGVELFFENRSSLENVESWEKEIEEQLTLDEMEERIKEFGGWIDPPEMVKVAFLLTYHTYDSDGKWIGEVVFSAIPHQIDNWEMDIWAE